MGWMELKLARVILFAVQVETLAAFYGEVLGLTRLSSNDSGFVEFEAGGCRLAIHDGGTADKPRWRGPKLVFGSQDVAACREALLSRGVKMGKLVAFEQIHLCDGWDPEGNVFQISDRP